MNAKERRSAKRHPPMVRHNPKAVGRPPKIGVEKGHGPRHAANSKEGDEADLTQINTDTVPAMLTPREAVLNRNAAEMAGRGNIEQLNQQGNELAKQGVDLAGGEENMKSRQKLQGGGYAGGGNPLKRGPDPFSGRTMPARRQVSGSSPRPGGGGPFGMPSFYSPRGPEVGQPAAYNPGGGGTSLGGLGTQPQWSGGMPAEVGQPAAWNPGGEVGQPAQWSPSGAETGQPAAWNPAGSMQGTTYPAARSQYGPYPSPVRPPNPGVPPGGFPSVGGLGPVQGGGNVNPMKFGNSFYPKGMGFAAGSEDILGGGESIYGNAAPVSLSAPSGLAELVAAIRKEGEKQGLSPNQIQGIIGAFGGMGGGGAGGGAYDTLGGQYANFDISGGGNQLGTANVGYQGGVSDIGYPPFIAPSAEFDYDRGGWVGPYDTRYSFPTY